MALPARPSAQEQGQPLQALVDFTPRARGGAERCAHAHLARPLYLDQGQPEKAQPLFERARNWPPRAVAALAGLGQAALAQRDYSEPYRARGAPAAPTQSASVHSPLAQAYRGLGDMAKAEAHQKQWRNTEVLVAGPGRQQLDLALESGLSYELRGVRALEPRDFPAAEGFVSTPEGVRHHDSGLRPGWGRSLRHKLATALYMQGDVRGAMTWFEETIKMAPPSGIDETAAKAHYSLGVLMASSGRGQEAISHLSAAVRFNPNYVEACQALADALRRSGKAEQSLTQYNEALRVNPKSADARFGTAWHWFALDDIARRATGLTTPRGSIPIVSSSHTRWRDCWRRHRTMGFAMARARRRSSIACCRAARRSTWARPWRWRLPSEASSPRPSGFNAR